MIKDIDLTKIGVGKNRTALGSVSAINLKEITVTFNQEIDKTTAETASNYTMSGNSFTASLGADGKTVTLFATNTLTNNSTANLVVKNVKTKAADATIADTTKAVTIADTTIPTVESVTAVSNKVFKVRFSEPIQTAPTAASYKIADALNGGAYGAFTPAAVAGSNDREFTVTTVNPIPAGDINFEVNITGTVNDYAGYVVPTVKKTVTIATDTIAPQADSVTVNNQTEVLVKFNKEVSEASVTAVQTNFKWNTTNTTSGAKAATTATKVDSTTYKVTFSGANAMAAGNGYFFVPAGITDIAGNVVAAKSFAVNIVADTTPAVTSVTVPSANIIQIKFNKAMDATSVTTRANYVIKDSQGTEITTPGSLSYDLTNKMVVLSGLTLSDTSYTVKMTNLKDNILQTMAETTQSFTNTPSAAAQSVDAARYLDEADGAGKDVVILPFDIPVATTGDYSILNAAKWTVNGAALTATYPNATLNINPADSKEVIIHLNADLTVAGADDNFAVNNFASTFGTIQTTSQAFSDITAAQARLDLSTAATSIKLLDNKTFELKVNRKLSSIDASEFAVMDQTLGADLTTLATDPNAIANASYVNTATGATITLTMTNALDTTHAYRLATKAVVTGTKDIDGLDFDVSKTYATNASISIAPKVVNTYVLDDTHVVVVLDQPRSTLLNFSDFIVKYDGTLKAPTAADGTGVSANEIRLTVPAGANTAGVVTVDTVAQSSIQTEGANATKITEIGDPMTANLFKINSVAIGDNDGILEVGDTVTVTFSKAVDATTLGFATDDKQSDNSYKKAAVAGVIAGTASGGAAAGENITLNAVSGGAAVTLTFTDVTGDYFSGALTGAADVLLSADGKTLTYTLTNIGGVTTTGANWANVTATTPADTLKSTDKELIDAAITTAQTSSKF